MIISCAACGYIQKTGKNPKHAKFELPDNKEKIINGPYDPTFKDHLNAMGENKMLEDNEIDLNKLRDAVRFINKAIRENDNISLVSDIGDQQIIIKIVLE